jgi:Zn-dependent alcohol dehydrogenases
MIAVGFKSFGGPDVLEELEIEEPKPEDGYAIVRISHTSVNRLDTLVRKGYSPGIALPHIPGSDVYGIIDRIDGGKNVFAEGDKVIVHPLISCGICAECVSGKEDICRKWGAIGREKNGSYAELVKIKVDQLFRPPAHLSGMELACLPLSLTAAWRGLVLSEPAPEKTVVIRGASGNVGIIALMLSKALGMRTIAITRNSIKATELVRIGADSVIDSSEPEYLQRLDDEVGAGGADSVLDCTGEINESIKIVKIGGKVISYGVLKNQKSEIDISNLYLKSVHVIGTRLSTRKEFGDAIRFVGENRICPIIGRELSITDAAEAHMLLEGSKVFGKILLKLN